MIYSEPPLVLTETTISDALGSASLASLPTPEPKCDVRLAPTTPLVERLWRIALSDIEANIVETEGGKYFGAGNSFGATVYTRDISYSGVLGLNRLYPQLMLDSIRHTRNVRYDLKFRVPKEYSIKDIQVPWIEEDKTEGEFVDEWKTNSYTRRTDDVIWLWCTADLLSANEFEQEWEWLYETGSRFFSEFYQPFYDPNDGLYFGQASFVDIHFPGRKTSGYPQDWSIEDCVMIKSLSTNCLYVLGLNAMSQAASRTGRESEAKTWSDRSEALKRSIVRELRSDDGTFTYFKDRNGGLQKRRDALGSALAVLSGVVSGESAKLALEYYPVTDGGVPLFHPFFDEDNRYHNNSSWPFVDTFFIKALEESDGINRTALNAALLARTCIIDGTFHEVTYYPAKEVIGSKSQLWSASAFVDTCLRAGLVKEFAEKSN